MTAPRNISRQETGITRHPQSEGILDSLLSGFTCAGDTHGVYLGVRETEVVLVHDSTGVVVNLSLHTDVLRSAKGGALSALATTILADKIIMALDLISKEI